MTGVLIQNMSFKTGQTLTITGIPKAESTNFALNIGNSAEDIALHMNPRFDAHGDQSTIIKISFTPEEFLVTLADGSEIHFPNRQGSEKYKYLHFEGEARIYGVEIK
ncbi:hypothetical protein DNTS_005919 [Danionella cerebrum]|uniref:Galectin n=1 Tax=Danionella cerebrum TaxID=2873325 RepID=A0A553N496_9TELE|nr:hypothetical protein DNTS_005919 [Danionella translucida]